jgi:hypothetical protein
MLTSSSDAIRRDGGSLEPGLSLPAAIARRMQAAICPYMGTWLDVSISNNMS